MTTTCKNCNHHFKGNFCSNCGQTAKTHEISLPFLWHDIQHGLLHFDKGALFTIKELCTRPGYSIREFIEGKRVQHFKPISFILILAGIYGFLINYFNITPFLKFSDEGETIKNIGIDKVMAWIGSHYALTTLLLLPFTSLATYWAFRKEKYNFVQHIVINSFLSGLRIAIRLPFFILLFLLDKENKMQLLNIPDIAGVGFTVWALFQFFDQIPAKKRIWKIILSYIYLGLLFFVLLLLAVAIIALLIEQMKHG
jgi:hypothetical protein